MEPPRREMTFGEGRGPARGRSFLPTNGRRMAATPDVHAAATVYRRLQRRPRIGRAMPGEVGRSHCLISSDRGPTNRDCLKFFS